MTLVHASNQRFSKMQGKSHDQSRKQAAKMLRLIVTFWQSYSRILQKRVK